MPRYESKRIPVVGTLSVVCHRGCYPVRMRPVVSVQCGRWFRDRGLASLMICVFGVYFQVIRTGPSPGEVVESLRRKRGRRAGDLPESQG